MCPICRGYVFTQADYDRLGRTVPAGEEEQQEEQQEEDEEEVNAVLTLSPQQIEEVMFMISDYWNYPNMQEWFNQALLEHIERRLRAFTSTGGIMRHLFNRAQRYYTDEIFEPLIGIRQDLDTVIAHAIETILETIAEYGDNNYGGWGRGEVTTERVMVILDAALLVRYDIEFAIAQLMESGPIRGLFERAQALAVLWDVNPNADNLLGRVRQGDFQMARELARQRFQEGGQYDFFRVLGRGETVLESGLLAPYTNNPYLPMRFVV